MRAVAAMSPELNIVDMRSRPVLENEDEFVLRAIKAAHAGVRLCPDAKIDRFEMGAVERRHAALDMAPVHTDVDKRAERECRAIELNADRKKSVNSAAVISPDGHREFAMAKLAEPGDMAVDRHIIGRVGEQRPPPSPTP